MLSLLIPISGRSLTASSTEPLTDPARPGESQHRCCFVPLSNTDTPGLRHPPGPVRLRAPNPAYIQTSLYEVAAARSAQIHFRVDRHVSRQSDLHPARHNPQRPFKAGRPARGEQLLGIGARPRRSRQGKLDVQVAIVAARGAPVAPTRRVDLGGVDHFFEFRHGRFPLESPSCYSIFLLDLLPRS